MAKNIKNEEEIVNDLTNYIKSGKMNRSSAYLH